MSLKKLYTALKGGIGSLQKDGQNAFAYVELFNDQPQKQTLETLRDNDSKPIAFIQVKRSEFMHLKNDVQRRTLTFSVYMTTAIFDQEGRNIRTQDDDNILDFFDLMEKVHQVIHYLQVPNFTPFVRTSEEQFVDEDAGENDNPDTQFDRMYTQIFTYETVEIDVTARIPKTEHTIETIALQEVETVNEDNPVIKREVLITKEQ